MKVKQLTIEGFRGFKDSIAIEFPENIPTVLVGINGAGKSAVLEAIVFCYAPILVHFTKERFFNPNTIGENINSFSSSYSLFLKQDFDHISGPVNTVTSAFRFSPIRHTGYDDIKSLIKQNIQHYKKDGLPVFVYYPTERAVPKPSLKNHPIRKKTLFDAWADALEKSIDFHDFFNWFKDTEDLENEIRLNDDIHYTHPALDAVRAAILEIIDGFSKLRVKRRGKLEIIVEKDGVQLSINQLSHGEKTLLALVGDLARRLAIANPNSKKPLEGNGVVLIDEIDLHLHPKWQKNIVKKLQKAFPNIQFILTTHSPIIISQLKSESIFLLEDKQCIPLVSKGVNSYGLTIEDVLLKIQGTSQFLPLDVESKFRKLFMLIDNGQIDQAKKLKAELEYLVEPTHPELLKSDADIKFKELLS